MPPPDWMLIVHCFYCYSDSKDPARRQKCCHYPRHFPLDTAVIPKETHQYRQTVALQHSLVSSLPNTDFFSGVELHRWQRDQPHYLCRSRESRPSRSRWPSPRPPHWVGVGSLQGLRPRGQGIQPHLRWAVEVEGRGQYQTVPRSPQRFHRGRIMGSL